MAMNRLVKVLLAGVFLLGTIAAYAEPAKEAGQDEPDKPRLVVQTGHGGEINALAATQDGRVIATGGSDFAVILWDAESGRQLRTLRGNTDKVVSVAFSPDGSKLVSDEGVGDGKSDDIKIWDVVSGNEIRSMSGCGGVVKFSPDGTKIAAACWHEIKVWSVETGQLITKFEPVSDNKSVSDNLASLAYSADGRYLVAGSRDGVVRQWDAVTGKIIRSFGNASSERFGVAVDLSSDGKLLVSAQENVSSGVGNSQEIAIWDVATGGKLSSFIVNHSYDVSVAFSGDGKSIVAGGVGLPLTFFDVATGKKLRSIDDGGSGSDHAVILVGDGSRVISFVKGYYRFNYEGSITSKDVIRIWDVSRAMKQRMLEVPADGSTATLKISKSGRDLEHRVVIFSPDGGSVFASDGDGTIRCREINSGKEVQIFTGHKGGVISLAISPDGRMLASAGQDNVVRIWDVSTGQQVKNLFTFTKKLSFIENGKYLKSENIISTTEIWDTTTWEEVLISYGILNNGQELLQGTWEQLAWSNTKIVRQDSDRNVLNVLDLSSKKIIKLVHEKPPLDWQSSADGRILVSKSDDNLKFFFWDIESGKQISYLNPQSPYSSLILSSDGSRAITRDPEWGVRLWDTANGKLLQTLKSYFPDSVSFSPNGKLIAVVAPDILAVLDTEFANDTKIVQGFGSAVRAVNVSSKGGSFATGGKDGLARVWDAGAGNQLTLGKLSFLMQISAVAAFPDSLTLATGGSDWVKLWDVNSGNKLADLGSYPGDINSEFAVNSIALTGDGKKLVSAHGNKIRLWDVLTKRELQTLTLGESIKTVSITNDGKTIAATQGASIDLFDAATGKRVEQLDRKEKFIMDTLAFSPDGHLLASNGNGDAILLWNVATGEVVATLGTPRNHVLKNVSGHRGDITVLTFSPDGRLLASGSKDRTLRIWDVATGRELRVLPDHGGEMTSISFSPDARWLFSGSTDGSATLWRVSDGAVLASLYSFTDGSWVVTDTEGRFDTSDLEEIKGLHWVMPDDLFTPVPLEAFMKDYYEPKLLARILNGEKFRPVPKVMDKNRVQPEVKLLSVVADPKDTERVNVTVEVSGNQKEYQRDGRAVPMKTAVHDLHLFRDGQLVGYIDGKVVEQGVKPFQKTFNVLLPSHKADQDITFSAYAFNDDRVKSNTVRTSYHAPSTLVARKGRAYVISMGVNQHDNPAWNLKFAANDARLVRQSVSDKLGKTGQYLDIVALSLISDGDQHHADKAALHAILDKLAGKPLSPQASTALTTIQGSDQLQTATPDDLILLTFSGHGFADDSGNFYLINQDTGTKDGKTITEALKQHSISSAELSHWLRDVDAGDMTLIVDACQSAASVQGDGFKPGPMGSRGLGQLSFDKGMRILAASQADEYALENDQLKQGLLSFSLVTDGLDAFNADREPKDSKIMLDEWLRYGVDRVPQLAEEVKTGHVHVANRGSDDRSAVRVSASAGGKSRPAQQPALFDFAKKRRQVEVAAGQR
ncbi:MAG: PQQ-binding-like beta-propeller repeat protein [Gallionella sp.]|nr:PQQ-binding-like beta-propeller repeat protein [Gallionella sp.]MDD4946533.1 PQQ-binding-like beta-propeller repeat protein [Gallionella sp.]